MCGIGDVAELIIAIVAVCYATTGSRETYQPRIGFTPGLRRPAAILSGRLPCAVVPNVGTLSFDLNLSPGFDLIT